MFTGLIAAVGRIESIDAGPAGARLRIADPLAAQLEPGDSVAVDGVCLTAATAGGTGFEVDAMNETLRTTALSDLGERDAVNLELALRPEDRLGGHMVQGHADGVGEVATVEEDGFARRMRVSLAPELLRYVVARGSIALQGVSLTVAALGEEWLEVSLIPETLKRTTLGEAEPGRRLNVECDLVAKYVERLVQPLAGEERT